MVPLGTAAIDFKLPGVDGEEYSLTSFSEDSVLVIIFMCNHCPYVKAVIQRLIDLQKEVSDQGVRLVGINCNDAKKYVCLLYTSPSPRDRTRSRMPSSA